MQTQPREGVQMVEGDLVRVPVVVADPDRDERRPGARGSEERRTGARVGAVMADLQHVDPRQQPSLA